MRDYLAPPDNDECDYWAPTGDECEERDYNVNGHHASHANKDK